MNQVQLKQFLYQANLAGYASGEEKQWTKEPDGSTTIVFEKNGLKSHDNYFGGEPYGGRIIVSEKEKPVWLMVYYGWVEPGQEKEAVYGVLRNALKQMPKEMPLRGPNQYQEAQYFYINSTLGGVEQFSGTEQITIQDQVIYQAWYMGGLVDQS